MDAAGVSYLWGVNIELGTFIKATTWCIACDSRSLVTVTWECKASKSSEFKAKLQQVKKKMQRHQKDSCLSESVLSHQRSGKALGSDWEKDLISNPHFQLLQIFKSFLSEAAARINCSLTKPRNTLVPSKHLGQHVYFYPIRTNEGEIVPSDRSHCGMIVACTDSHLMVPEACHGPNNLRCQLS